VSGSSTCPNETPTEDLGSQHSTQQSVRSSGEIRQGQFQQASKRAISEQEEEDREAEVRRRAYKIWQLEGKPDGLAEQHWERAKQEVHQQEQAEARRDGAAGQRTGIQPHGDGGTSLRRDLAD
jgi:hypothetical protein